MHGHSSSEVYHQIRLEEKISTFLVAMGEDELAKFTKGLCNAWAFMNFMNDALDQKNINIVRMQKIMDQDSKQSAALYQEYKSAYVALVEAKGEGDIPKLNRELEDIEKQVTKLRKENEEEKRQTILKKNQEIILQLEKKRRDLRDARSNLIEKSLTKQFGEEKYGKLKEAEAFYLYINALYAAFNPERYLQAGNLHDYIETLKIVGPEILGAKDEKEKTFPVEEVLDIAFNFSDAELIDFFNNKVPNTILDGDMIQITSSLHAIYLSYKNGKYFLYNPSPIALEDNKGKTVVAALKSAQLFLSDTGYMPLQISIMAKKNSSTLERPKRIEIIKSILNEREKNRNLNLDAVGPDGLTAVAIATRAGHVDTTHLLIEKRCNINMTALKQAILFNREDLLTEFIEHDNAVLRARNAQGQSLLEIAIARRSVSNENIIKKILDSKVDIEARNQLHQTAAHIAAQYGKVEVLKILAERKADLNTPDFSGHTSVFIAAEFGQVEAVRMLASKFSLGVQEKLELAAEAAIKGHLSVIKILDLPDLSARVRGETLAIIAARNGRTNVVEYLAECKADINIPLLTAARFGQVEVVRMLTSKFPLGAQEKLALAADAAERGYLSVIKVLELPDLSARVRGQETLATIAARTGRANVIEYLADKKVDLSVSNDQDETPASLAATKGHLVVIKTLNLSDLFLSTILKNGETLATAAAKSGHTHIIQYLADKKADLSAKNSHNQTPLEIAATFGNVSVIKKLLENKINVNEKNINHGWTAAHIAANFGQISALEILIQNNADLNAPDKNGLTPLHLAINNQAYDTVKSLLDLKANLYHGQEEKKPIDLANIEMSAFIMLQQIEKYIKENLNLSDKNSIPSQQLNHIEAEMKKDKKDRNWNNVFTAVFLSAKQPKILKTALETQSTFAPRVSDSEKAKENEYLKWFSNRKQLSENLEKQAKNPVKNEKVKGPGGI